MYNTATGLNALYYNVHGTGNTAIGVQALLNTTGGNNTGIGMSAGDALTIGSYNIDIANVGVAGDDHVIRIGSGQTQTFVAGINGVDKSNGQPVFIDANGQLGTGTLATGPAGPTGATGATGPAGPAGATGAAGADGAVGPAGPAGPVGATGAAGAQGPAGPVGATGAAGAQGPAGPVGATGAAGAQGPAGPVGATGPIGPSGWITGGTSGQQNINLDNNHPVYYFPVTGVVGQMGGFVTESIAQQPMGSATTLSNFTVVLEGDTGAGKGYNVSVRKNGVSVATAICLSGGDKTVPAAFTVTTPITFAAGDLIDLSVVGNNNPGGGHGVSWRMTFHQ